MMNPIAQWRAYMGPKDERLEAETNRSIRVGYFILLIGSLIALCYGTMAGQVAYTTNHALITPLGETVVNTHSVLWVVVMASLLVVGILDLRKGLLSERARFAKIERIPWDFVALVSLGGSLVLGVTMTLMRILAEIQIVGIAEVTWAGDIAMGVAYSGLFFPVCFLAVAATFHVTIKQRRKLERELDN